MTSLKIFICATSILFGATSCKQKVAPETKTIDNQVVVEDSERAKIENPNTHFTKAEFTISGMTCAMGCAATIQKQLSKIKGVKSAKVNFEKELALVEYDDAQVNPELLTNAVTGVSKEYQVSDMKMVDTLLEEE
ncbi:heavy metal-associated domain-containing protein [Gaetbulibacter sp. M240]|uniref:heavy-metal-associated domain-containing protein n=1 Tax=Gaetbulibacter sp. M240 TaxID=3126511 RepID=UPI00374E2EAC